LVFSFPTSCNHSRESYAKQADIIVEAIADNDNRATSEAVTATLVKLLSQNKEKIVFYTSGTWVPKIF
jgi:transcriptional/translational regulatory protein YebC/TACO1